MVVERYFCLGDGADETADRYLEHYYGAQYFPYVRADTVTSRERLFEELRRLAETGCDDLVLFPCTGARSQVRLLADALADGGWEM